MKTLNVKETLAWVALACAIVLFSFTIGFAQTKDESKVTIRIEKNINGKTETFDTTFTAQGGHDPYGINRPRIIPLPTPIPDPVPNPDPIPFNPQGDSAKANKHSGSRMSEEDNDHFKEHMQTLNDEMNNFHFEFKGNDNNADKADNNRQLFYKYLDNNDSLKEGSFAFPDMPELNNLGKYMKEFQTEYNGDSMIKNMKIIINNDVLADNDHDAAIGDDDEDVAAPEKNTGKDPNKVIIYKRIIIKDDNEANASAKANETNNDLQLNNLAIYPNPNGGSFTLNFHLDTPGDLNVQVTDMQGREILVQKFNDFSGDYSNSFDLSDKGKGIYILSIEQNNKRLNKTTRG